MKKNEIGLTFLATLQASLTVACLLPLSIWWPSQMTSFLIGAIVSLANLLALAVLWRLILGKKPVATIVTAIVIKYPILIGLLFFAIMRLNLELGGLFAGLATGFGAICLVALWLVAKKQF